MKKLNFDIRTDAIRSLQALRTAEQETQPILGVNTLAFDSADDCYREALERMGVDAGNVHPSGLRQVYLGALRSGRRCAPVDLSGFPDIERIRQI